MPDLDSANLTYQAPLLAGSTYGTRGRRRGSSDSRPRPSPSRQSPSAPMPPGWHMQPATTGARAWRGTAVAGSITRSCCTGCAPSQPTPLAMWLLWLLLCLISTADPCSNRPGSSESHSCRACLQAQAACWSAITVPCSVGLRWCQLVNCSLSSQEVGGARQG